MSELTLPTYDALEPSVLGVIAQGGGSLKRSEVMERAVTHAGITDEQLAVVYAEGSSKTGSVVLDRISWALSHLKLMGALDNSTRGVWSVTPHGRELLASGPEAILEANRRARLDVRRQRGKKTPIAVGETETEAAESLAASEDETWRSQLLALLMALPPDAFERLCARLLREIGCRDVEVTSYSGDEGLDGIGVLEVSLLSFPVFFQAKRYKATHTIQPNMIREFRGAMAHRGDKGFFITTSVFTSKAREEAKRGTPIDLIDGDRLCDLLRENNLGVEFQPVVNPEFFSSI